MPRFSDLQRVLWFYLISQSFMWDILRYILPLFLLLCCYCVSRLSWTFAEDQRSTALHQESGLSSKTCFQNLLLFSKILIPLLIYYIILVHFSSQLKWKTDFVSLPLPYSPPGTEPLALHFRCFFHNSRKVAQSVIFFWSISTHARNYNLSFRITLVVKSTSCFLSSIVTS